METREIKPCRCGADIQETFEVQLIWRGGGENIGVAYCKECKLSEPFKVYNFERSIVDKAIEAWNKRTGDEE